MPVPLAFGDVAPCRTCHGTGLSRNPDWGDKDAAKQRARQRRHGQDVDKPRELMTCVECKGAGYLPLAVADATKTDRAALQAKSVIQP